ncbi:RsiG family protein [Streptacidiphilus griseoplanus]|uniref:RsiG family protein n=1 Tax=Peterkaempfera griseoplana TaxID=66896 RepID=UPI000ADA2A00|nr:ABC transporter substrate-binding protein [Peterkaempfera griseoplana]
MDEHNGSDGASGPSPREVPPAVPPGVRAPSGLGLDELRALRRSAQEDEADLSYLRRLLQGRIDIIRAELARRSGGAQQPAPAENLLDRLPQILADGPARFRSARHVTLGTPRGERYGDEADRLMGDVQLADLAANGDAALAAALERLSAHEREVSRRRQSLQGTVDRCSAEITRRYREGEARIEDLLAGDGHRW